MLFRIIAIAAITVAAGGSAICQAAEPSGEAIAVIQATSVEGAGGNRPLEVKGPVFMGDLVKTDRAGQAQLLFRDDTRMVVGPNSELTIDTFVFANQSTAREFTINAVRGAFRFITGSSRKQAYKIVTPTATIGVRGTRFDVTVDDATSLALYDGTVNLCDKTVPRPRCTELTGRCSVLILAPNEEFRWVNNVYERTALMDTVFPYAFRQGGLRTDFRVQSNGCIARSPFIRETIHSGGPPPDRPDEPRQRDPQGGNDNPNTGLN